MRYKLIDERIEHIEDIKIDWLFEQWMLQSESTSIE